MVLLIARRLLVWSAALAGLFCLAYPLGAIDTSSPLGGGVIATCILFVAFPLGLMDGSGSGQLTPHRRRWRAVAYLGLAAAGSAGGFLGYKTGPGIGLGLGAGVAGVALIATAVIASQRYGSATDNSLD